MIRLYAEIAAVALAFAAGAIVTHKWHKASELEAQIQSANELIKTQEEYREEERLAARTRADALGQYAKSLQKEGAKAADARADLERLRISLAASSQTASEGADSCGPERARIRELSDILAEGARLAAEGGEHVGQLRAKRDALIGVK